MKFPKNLGLLLMGAWLILTGLIEVVHLSFSGLRVIMGIIALAAGLLIVVNWGAKAGA